LNYARPRAVTLWRGKPAAEPATRKSYRPYVPCQPAARKSQMLPGKI